MDYRILFAADGLNSEDIHHILSGHGPTPAMETAVGRPMSITGWIPESDLDNDKSIRSWSSDIENALKTGWTVLTRHKHAEVLALVLHRHGWVEIIAREEKS